MSAYDETTDDDRIAEVYDAWYTGVFDEQAAVSALKDLAGAGRALELGIGRAGSRCRWRRSVLRFTVSTRLKRWSRSYAPSPAEGRIPVTMGNFAEVGVVRK